eukprot:1667056-Prymnesium_polylepis.1
MPQPRLLRVRVRGGAGVRASPWTRTVQGGDGAPPRLDPAASGLRGRRPPALPCPAAAAISQSSDQIET